MGMIVLVGENSNRFMDFDRDNAGYAGQFIWTGTDYIGEPTPWHNQNQTPVKSSYFGIVDTAGIQNMTSTSTKANGFLLKETDGTPSSSLELGKQRISIQSS